MSLILISMALAAQQPAQPAQRPLPSDPPRAAEATPAHEIFYQDERSPLSARAREVMHEFGRCAAQRSPDMAARTLSMNFTSTAYRNAMSQLSRNNEGCLDGARRMRGAGLLFAGALAEGLLDRGEAPLNARLARAATGAATPAYSPSDRVAICVVRSVPDQVATLFDTAPASDGEEAAMQQLLPAFEMCAQGGPQVRGNEAGLRAMLATAAFRSVGADIARSN